MKKLMRILLLIALLTAALCITAAAVEEATDPGMYDVTSGTGVTITPDTANTAGVTINSGTATTNYYKNAVKFTVSATGYTAGEQCLILVVAGDKGTAITESSIYYINQTTVPTGGTVSFDVYPKDMAKDHYCVYLISNSHPYNSTSPTAAAEFDYNIPYKLGDADGDDSVTSADAAKVLRHVAQLETLSGSKALAANVDGDKDITSADAAMILRYVAQLITKF